jgi:hypothetical protein
MTLSCLHDILDLLISICSCKGLDQPPRAPAKMNADEVADGGLGLQPHLSLS